MSAKILTGKETFSYTLATSPKKTLLDFWAWNCSDLMNNTLRGALAEYIVAMSLNIPFSSARCDWSEYDLITNDNIRIEVKCSAYLQSWEQSKLSEIRFSCGPSQSFSNQKYDGISLRHSDAYIFCIYTCKEKEKSDILNLDDWLFYILPTNILNREIGLQKTISLNALLRLKPTKAYYHEIYEALHSALNLSRDM